MLVGVTAAAGGLVGGSGERVRGERGGGERERGKGEGGEGEERVDREMWGREEREGVLDIHDVHCTC